MDSVFEAYLEFKDANSLEPDDIPKTNDNVWILGKRYNAIQEIELIRRDILSRIWCTYRHSFPAIGDAQLTSDKGWGCMLRCGQMVLAQALIDLHLGRDWFWTPETRDPTYLKIINRFEDTRKSEYSIHQIALMGDSEYKKVGEWFGPNNIAQVLKKLVSFDDWCSIVVHVSLDNTIITDEIYELCDDKKNDTWHPLLLLVPLRLGISEVNPIYVDGIKKCFEMKESVGMIGGRPNQALYFFGYVGDDALYLDPHTNQKCGTIGQKQTTIEIDCDETYHRKYAARISLKQMDPSLAMCFVCKTKSDFQQFCADYKENVVAAGIQSIFEILQTKQKPWHSQMKSSIDPDILVVGDYDEMENAHRNDLTDDEYEIID